MQRGGSREFTMAVRGTADVYKGWHFGLTGPR